MPSFQKAYGPRHKVKMTFNLPSRTKQSFVEESNINNIMSKYEKTGVLDHLNKHGGSYANLPTGLDFQASINMVIDAQNVFDDLPASIRSRFGNDPAAYLSFATDPSNKDELVRMGLAHAKRAPEGEDPVSASVTADTNSPSQAPAEAS